VGRQVSNKNALYHLLSFMKALQKHFFGSFNILELYAYKRLSVPVAPKEGVTWLRFRQPCSWLNPVSASPGCAGTARAGVAAGGLAAGKQQPVLPEQGRPISLEKALSPELDILQPLKP